MHSFYSNLKCTTPDNDGTPLYAERQSNGTLLVKSQIELTVQLSENCTCYAGYFLSEEPKSWTCDQVKSQGTAHVKGVEVGDYYRFTFLEKKVKTENPDADVTQNLYVWIVNASGECIREHDGSPIWAVARSSLIIRRNPQVAPTNGGIDLEESDNSVILGTTSNVRQIFGGSIPDPVGDKNNPAYILPFLALPGSYMIPSVIFAGDAGVKRAIATVVRQGTLVNQWPVGSYLIDGSKVPNSSTRWEFRNVPIAVADDLVSPSTVSKNQIVVYNQSNSYTWDVVVKPIWCTYAINS
jgi:hypothetical protein